MRAVRTRVLNIPLTLAFQPLEAITPAVSGVGSQKAGIHNVR